MIRRVQDDLEYAEVREACVTGLIDQNIGLEGQLVKTETHFLYAITYTLEVPVNYFIVVEVGQSPSDTCQLGDSRH